MNHLPVRVVSTHTQTLTKCTAPQIQGRVRCSLVFMERKLLLQVKLVSRQKLGLSQPAHLADVGGGGSSEGRRSQAPPADGVPHRSTRPWAELVVSSKFSQKCKQSGCNFSKGQNPEWCRDWKNIEMEHWDIRQCKSSH